MLLIKSSKLSIWKSFSMSIMWKVLTRLLLSLSLTFMGITKPCPHLHPSPPSSFQPPPSSLRHPQQYLNQNIARNWAISPNLGRKIKICPFWLKISIHGILEVLIFHIPTPKFIFGQIWAQKFKVVRFVWKLVHIVSQGCWFQIPT